MRIDELPEEVIWAIAIGTQKLVGLETYNKVLEVYKKYPRYFPQEYKYHFVVPEEVHIEYRKERDELRDGFYPHKPLGVYEGEGLVAYCKRMEKENSPAKIGITREDIENLFKSIDDEAKKEDNYNKNLKKVWDKYYKKYGIRFERE